MLSENRNLTEKHRISNTFTRRYWIYFLAFLSLGGFCLIYFPLSSESSISISDIPQESNKDPIHIDVHLENHFDVEEIRSILENPEKSKNQKELVSRLYAIGAGGGLGNVLFELFAFLGIAKFLNRRPIVNAADIGTLDGIVKHVYPIFPELIKQFDIEFRSEATYTTVSAHRKGVCRYDDPTKFLDYQQNVLYVNGVYFQSFRYFHHIRSDVRRGLLPKEQFMAKADEKLPEKYRDDFILCVHTRRGDFAKDTIHEPSNATFTRFATDFLVREYQKSKKKVTVIIIGNDMRWAYSVFQDRAVDVEQKLRDISNIPKNNTLPELPKNSPNYTVIIKDTAREVDLAFSRKYCDSVLITAPSSTFGWFLGYNSKTGNEVFYRNINETRDKVAKEMNREDFFPPEWVMLETTKDGKIIKS